MATKTVKRIKLSNNSAKQVDSFDDVSPKKNSPEPRRPKKSSTKRQFKASTLLMPFIGIARYIKGSWQELRLVRWPNRKATWGLTLAVLIFTAFFVVIIIILDTAFQYLFKEVLLK